MHKCTIPLLSRNQKFEAEKWFCKLIKTSLNYFPSQQINVTSENSFFFLIKTSTENRLFNEVFYRYLPERVMQVCRDWERAKLLLLSTFSQMGII